MRIALLIFVSTIGFAAGCGDDQPDNPPHDPGAVAKVVNEAFAASQHGDGEAFCDSLVESAQQALVKVATERGGGATQPVDAYDFAGCPQAFSVLHLERDKQAPVNAGQVSFDENGDAVIDEPGSTGNALPVIWEDGEWKLGAPFYTGR